MSRWTRVRRWNDRAAASGSRSETQGPAAERTTTPSLRSEASPPSRLAQCRTRRKRSLEAASCNSAATQFSRPSGETTYLVLGLDFGTSCTKAVIRSPYAMRSRATAVAWPSRLAAAGYLLPTVLHEADGAFDLEPTRGSQRHADVKVHLMDDANSVDARVRATAHLGLALRAARQWFLDTQRDVYGRLPLRWALNVGIPSAGYDDQQVREAFEAVARAAWQLSLRPEHPTRRVVIDALREGEEALDSLENIAVIPEIAAAVVGYARSKHRREGLHVLVDVGASTLDICGFVLHQADDGRDQYSLLTALVKKLGLHELHGRRMHAAQAAGARLAPDVPALSPFTALPIAGRTYLDRREVRLRQDLDAVDRGYREECVEAIMLMLMDLRKRRDPRSPHWNSGLPVFMGGGGGRSEIMREIMREAQKRLVGAVPTRGIKREHLPALSTLSNEDIPNDMAGRLDVAYGLSIDEDNIGETVPPELIIDILPMSQREHEGVSKEQV